LVATTPKDNSKKAWPEADRRRVSGKRQIIEGGMDHLKDFFTLERRRVKTMGDLMACFAEDHGLHLRSISAHHYA
jgi:hypothetical protein